VLGAIENSVRLSYLLDGESAVDWQGDSGDEVVSLFVEFEVAVPHLRPAWW
jgi:hypothetical protein